MNIELEEVVGLDVSDDALELAAGGGHAGIFSFQDISGACYAPHATAFCNS
jgi:hypothetical protein